MDGQPQGPPRERLLGELMGRQHGVASRRQLMKVGFGPDRIDSWVRRGLLVPIERGVYGMGHKQVTWEGRCAASLLSFGDAAVLSHRSAAALWGLLERRPQLIELTVPGYGRRSRGRTVVHGSRSLGGEQARRHGLKVTRPERTLIDLGERASPRALQRAADEGIRLRVTSERRLADAVRRHPGRRGAAALGALLAEHAAGTTATQNEFEELFIALCDEHGIPRPVCQPLVGSFRPDFAWPDHGLVVEANGFATHGTRRAFESDRRRDAELRALGWTVLRFTWRQITTDPEWVASMIRAALGR